MHSVHGTHVPKALSQIFESSISGANEAKQNALQAKRSESSSSPSDRKMNCRKAKD
ncbi:protein of unknown function [Shinella sp. WSC3-e]|nr:hypothetical protein SHINE37_42171 [Rhizobiaceae bacterium]CAK7256764.1 protein of unknown function [Shinella sp. WSC3-e]